MRRLYHILALLALIHLFALAGLIGFMVYTGRLTAERVDQIAMVLRGELPAVQAAPAATAPAPPEPSRVEIQRSQAQREYYALVAERHQRELEDRRRLNQTIQLDVNRKLEEIERQKALLAEQRQKLAEASGQEGFAQVVNMYAAMEPAKAKELLRKSSDADAAAILSQMDEFRCKKIFSACKTQEELDWLGRILSQIRQPTITGAGVDGPKPASAGG